MDAETTRKRTAGAPLMAAISEAKLAANRENAKKSTGPRTPEGKERSRANALKHGLSGEGVVRVEEMEQGVRSRVAEWAEALGPKTEPERWLAERAAVDSVRVDAAVRCGRGKHASSLRREDFELQTAEVAEAQAERLGEKLMASAGDLRPIRRRLRATAAGCSWMIAKWESLARRLAGSRGWLPIDHDHAERLMGAGGLMDRRHAAMAADFLAQSELACGRPPHDGPDFVADLTGRLERSGWFARDFADPMNLPGDTVSRARARLRTLIAEEIAALCERRDRLAGLEVLDASEAAERSCVDLSPEAMLLFRYEQELHRRVLRSLRELERLQSQRAEESASPASASDVPPPAPPRNEPTAAPKPLPMNDLPSPSPLLPSPFRLDPPAPTPPLPIRMVPVTPPARR